MTPNKIVDDKMIGQMMRLAHREPRLSLRKIGDIVGVDHQVVNYWINPFRNHFLKSKSKRKSFLKRFFCFK